MSLQTAMLATLIVIAGAAQYTLCYQALRDLRRRPRVRGDNKALWGLGILCVPIAGANNTPPSQSKAVRNPNAREAGSTATTQTIDTSACAAASQNVVRHPAVSAM